MEFSMLRPAIQNMQMNTSAAKINLHFSVKPQETSDLTPYTGVRGNLQSNSNEEYLMSLTDGVSLKKIKK